MIKTESKAGRAVLMVAHCAGMVDLVALPVWVGTLISHYGFDPQQAGGLVTLFLAGAVASSVFFAPRFNRIAAGRACSLGFALAALAFFAMATTHAFAPLALLHAAAGASVGCALSFTHGTIGRSANPHRLFALVGIAVGVFGIAFLAGTPQLVAAFGGYVLFVVFGSVMAVAAAVCGVAFPVPGTAAASPALQAARMDPSVWFAVFTVSCMALVQAMMFSFVERIGSDRGFGFSAVSGVLIAVGLITLLPPPLAALLQGRISARKVVLAGPCLQAVLALTLSQSTSFGVYAVAATLFVPVMIFTHTFAFGVLAALDPSGRAVAATPAMLMVGAAIGPVLGGTLVKAAGYGSLGYAAVIVAALAIAAFSRVQPRRVNDAAIA